MNSIIRTEKVDFFNRVWGTKSKTYLAIKEGSSIHIGFDTTINDELNKQLQHLINSGIGELTHIGYGRIKNII